jgi:DNA-binding transcriptional LysR family regulator
VSGPKTPFRSSSIVAQQTAVAAGLGFGILHVFSAEPQADLVRVLPDEVSIRRAYWLAVHADQRRLPRIRAVVDFLLDVVRTNSGRFGAT